MNFVIDQGNTFSKLAVFEGDKLVKHEVVKEIDDQIINSFISKYDVKQSLFSSVRGKTATKVLKKYNFLELSYLTPLPLTINYKTPETLGIDRIAAVVGAKKMHAATNLLVIDMGTCITVDLLSSKGIHLGGSISLGLKMRLKALNEFTGKLPLIELTDQQPNRIGDTTETSILSGVYYGVKNELEGVIQDYMAQYSDLKIVVTGGDSNLFDLEPKNRIFADDFLVLKGLNEIIRYNEKK